MCIPFFSRSMNIGITHEWKFGYNLSQSVDYRDLWLKKLNSIEPFCPLYFALLGSRIKLTHGKIKGGCYVNPLFPEGGGGEFSQIFK